MRVAILESIVMPAGHEVEFDRILVEELKKREGVRIEYAEPYQDKKISVNGPAVILVIID